MPPLQSLLTQALNQPLEDATWARRRLRGFAGDAFAIDAPPFRIRLRIDDEGLFSMAPDEALCTVTLHLSPGKLPVAALLQGETEPLMQAVTIEGKAELADALGFVFRNLRPDVEETLSHVTGDILAHRLTKLFAALHQDSIRALASLAANLSEYAVFEAQWLADRAAASEFAEDVVKFRDDIARLEKRTERLSRARRSAEAKNRRSRPGERT